ncbi:hypothetical protein CHU98_g3527 [Xylaria longipes]|nr:hypothetical protein CHU98_g3527 [Xylaria longipes]
MVERGAAAWWGAGVVDAKFLRIDTTQIRWATVRRARRIYKDRNFTVPTLKEKRVNCFSLRRIHRIIPALLKWRQARIRPRAYAAQAAVPSKTKASKNTKGIKWPKLDSAIVLWDDFCLSTLNEDEDESYGHMLDLEVPAAQLAAGSRSASPMTSCISTRRRRSFNNAVPHAYIYKDQVLVRVAHRVSLDEFPLQNLVVGLGRPSSKLQCRQVARWPATPAR